MWQVLRKVQTPSTEPRRATYQDVIDAPPHMVAEIVDGKLYTSPRPGPKYAVALSRLGGAINHKFDFGNGEPGSWQILLGPELHFDDDVVVPDIAGWRCQRMPHLPTEEYFPLAPDWVCEVVSPTTRELDLSAKLMVYTRAGVARHWLVDPNSQSLSVYELRDGKRVLADQVYEDAVVSLPPFETITFNLGCLWAPGADQEPRTMHKETPVVEPRSG